MMLKQVLPLFLIAIAIGWFMPADDEAALSQLAAETAEPHTASAALATGGFDSGVADDVEQLLPDRIELAREADGHFYADVAVNQSQVRFMVDTGATAVALTGDDARAIGLNWSADELQAVGRGASGDVVGKQVIIDRMQIGNVQANNVRAVIIPQGLDVSLLGQTFLARVDSVNIRDNKMVWN
jgi:aspartyl protease family protein